MERISEELSRRLQTFVQDLAVRFDHVILRTDPPELKLPRRSGFASTVTVPTHVLEWFVGIEDHAEQVVWEDWADYFWESPVQLLELEMRHIQRYVEAWCSAESVRFAPTQPSPSRLTRWLTRPTAPDARVVMEWLHEGMWSPVEMVIEDSADH